ncbi:carboxy-cis,cis-muconate cyclase [Bifidobacterium aemilianum]|uniref:Carboxy-cis,cis-muconate cyclase n=1 Tax=Bifidobacterium aemilianum TaxID=2493120 RepID=A0A366K9V5_9BIFI|nr:beta-propeller fold lactonase family protein [Bifidobacterium aemilianum]RBP97948.1 carboxy-cis,cis-muconate cyclase [Bifidobacterium aemilianum]
MTEEITHLLVGGFGPLNGQTSPGIELYDLVESEADGGSPAGDCRLINRGLLADMPSPTWLFRDGQMLYAVLENSDQIASLRLGQSHGHIRLEELGRAATLRLGPTHAIVMADDLGVNHCLAADYGDGSISIHPVDAEGRVLDADQVLTAQGHGPLPAQAGPHAHWLLPLPDGRLLSTDLGADRVHIHRWQQGRLVRTNSLVLPAGTGPRDLTLLPTADGRIMVALVAEWANTVSLVDCGTGPNKGASGMASPPELEVVDLVDLGGTLMDDQAASMAFVSSRNSCRGMVYVGLRGSDRIVSLNWDGQHLRRLSSPDVEGWSGWGISSGGSRPRQIRALGSKLLVANEASNNLTVFQLAADGQPQEICRTPASSPTILLPML